MSRAIVDQSSSEWRRFVGDAEFGLHAKGASCGLRYQLDLFLRFSGRAFSISVVFRRMWIRSLDLHEALRTNRLIATSCFVQIRGVIHETDGTLGGVFVKESLCSLTIDIWVIRKIELLRSHFCP